MIKNIVFDIGMVLVDFQWRRQMEDLNFPEEVIRFLGDNLLSETWDDIDKGVLANEEVLKRVEALKPEYGKYIWEFWEHLEGTIVPYDYSGRWLKELKEEGYKIYLLTNYPDWLFQKNVKDRFPFYPYVDGEIVSSEVKHIKPEPEIYQILLKTYGLKAEECVFTDDKIKNIEGARKQGFHAFVFTGYPQAAKELKEIIAKESEG